MSVRDATVESAGLKPGLDAGWGGAAKAGAAGAWEEWEEWDEWEEWEAWGVGELGPASKLPYGSPSLRFSIWAVAGGRAGERKNKRGF